MSGTCFECKFMRQRADLEPCEYCANVFAMTGVHPNFDPKPMTHFDEIKAMSVEELAKLFVSGWYDGPLFACPVKDDGCESDIPCDVCFLNWLKSPAEEGR